MASQILTLSPSEVIQAAGPGGIIGVAISPSCQPLILYVSSVSVQDGVVNAYNTCEMSAKEFITLVNQSDGPLVAFFDVAPTFVTVCTVSH